MHTVTRAHIQKYDMKAHWCTHIAGARHNHTLLLWVTERLLGHVGFTWMSKCSQCFQPLLMHWDILRQVMIILFIFVHRSRQNQQKWTFLLTALDNYMQKIVVHFAKVREKWKVLKWFAASTLTSVVHRGGWLIPSKHLSQISQTSNIQHLTSAKEENKQGQCQVQLRHRTPLIHCLLWAREPRPNSPRVCCLHIHLGKDTQRWHSLSAHCYKPGDLSATTRPAVNWARFMEPAGDYLQLGAPRCLCAAFKIYLNNYVFPILWIRLNNGLQSARIERVSLHRDIWSRAVGAPR